MSTQLEDYGSKYVQVAFMGKAVDGLADTFMSASQNSDFTSSKVGADGSVGTSISPDETGTVELTVDQNAPVNILLSGVIELQRLNKKLYRGAFTYKDPSGGAIAKFSRVHIQGGPTLVGASERQDRTWTLFVEEYKFLAVPAGATDTLGVLADISAALETVASTISV